MITSREVQREFLARIARDEAAGRGPMILLEVGEFTAFNIIAALQLACRHPQIEKPLQLELLKVVDILAATFKGTPAEDTIRDGDPR